MCSGSRQRSHFSGEGRDDHIEHREFPKHWPKIGGLDFGWDHPFAAVELVWDRDTDTGLATSRVRVAGGLSQAQRELSEAREQQAATSEVLRVIASSSGELQPVFGTILANATRICETKFGTLYLCEGEGFRAVAMQNAPPAFAEARPRDAISRPPPAATQVSINYHGWR